ncbi:MAG: hypothetical protein GY861_17050 [bacterium]|nr:hypothetical protein [bacterium]
MKKDKIIACLEAAIEEIKEIPSYEEIRVYIHLGRTEGQTDIEVGGRHKSMGATP